MIFLIHYPFLRTQDASFHVSVHGKMNDPLIQKTLSELKARFNYVELNNECDEVPWFPRNIKDLELCNIAFQKTKKNHLFSGKNIARCER